MTTQFQGSCLCGEVRFSIDGSFERFFLCHCSRCRKNTGSAHGANLFSSTAKLTWQAGQHLVTTFKVPNARHARSFCATCGSALPLSTPSMLVVPAGSLDTPFDFAPTGNIFSASRAEWDHDLHLAPEFPSFPT